MKNESWSDLSAKEKAAIITAFIAFIIGWGLTVAGFVVPPVGEVADSILWVLGQALVYAASVFGITSYFTSETKRMKRDMENYFERRIKEEENAQE